MKASASAVVTALFLGLIAWPAHAATYYVDTNHASAADGNPGTESLPWKTISKANATLQPGDTVVVAAGTYDEEINPRQSGAAGAPITYVAKPGLRPVVRHVIFMKKEYIRVIGFEITQNSKAYRNAVEIYGSHHCEILNNSIHHTFGQGIRNNAYYGHSNYNVIRGNVIAYTGYPQDLPGEARGANGIALLGNYNLIEYNDISHTLDFVDTNGGFNVIRNNAMHDFKNSDFPDGSGDTAHVDIWQPFGVPGGLSDHNVFEFNWASDNLEHNSHFVQIRDETNPRSGEKEFVIRGNVAMRMGSYACQFGAIDNVHFYNNTLVDLCCSKPDDQKAWTTIGFNMEGDNPSVGSYVLNNIFYAVCRPTGGRIISLGEGCSAEMSHNACEKSGSHPSCSVTADIRFADYSQDDLGLANDSRAIGAGRPMTVVTSPAGNGTTFAVKEAGFFIDGFSIVDGDSIRIGNNDPATITQVDHAANMITIGSAISWKPGDPVVLAYQDAAPDIGAYPLRDDFSFDVKLQPPSTLESGKTRLSAEATRPENIRFVMFYVDNLPVGVVKSPPFTLEWDGAKPGRRYHLTATAYARFAAKQPTKSDSIYEIDNTITAFDVQKGSTGRGFIRYADVTFQSADGLADLVANNRVKLTRYELDGSGSGVPVPLTGLVSVNGNQLSLNFGPKGLGGSPNTTKADGYYDLAFDLNGDATFETHRHFYRLLGDVNGDRKVTVVDANLILAAYRQKGANLRTDVNGDGSVSALDRTLTIRSLSRKLADGLTVDDY